MSGVILSLISYMCVSSYNTFCHLRWSIMGSKWVALAIFLFIYDLCYAIFGLISITRLYDLWFDIQMG